MSVNHGSSVICDKVREKVLKLEDPKVWVWNTPFNLSVLQVALTTSLFHQLRLFAYLMGH